MTKVINLVGASGSGKSTLAAAIFVKLKVAGYRAEIPFEYPKELVYQERWKDFARQIYIFGKMLHRFECLDGKVDYIVSDSPLLLSLMYHDGSYGENFEKCVLDVFNQFENHNFFIRRVHSFKHEDRNETQEESNQFGQKVFDKLLALKIPFTVVDGDVKNVELILTSMGVKL